MKSSLLSSGARRRGTLLRALLVVAVVALTAAVAAGTGAAGGNRSATADPIKVMTITDLNSQGPVYPNIKYSAQAYAAWINAKGGINGHKLDLQVCDAQGSPTQATACARKAISSKVTAVIGSFTFTGDAIMPVLSAGNTAYFGMCCAISALEFSSKYSFPIGNQPMYGVGLVKRAVQDGCKKMGTVIIQGAESFIPALNNAAKGLGTKFVTNVTLPATSQDYSPQVAQATSGTDCLIMIVSETPYIAWMAPFAQSGAKVRMYGPQGNLNQKVAKGYEKAAEGSVIGGMFADMSLPQWAGYRAALKLIKAPPGEDYNSFGGMGTWAAYSAFTQIVKTIKGPINNASFFATASKAKLNLPGMIPRIDFTKEWTNGIPGLNRLFNRTVIFSKIHNGQVVPLTNKFEDVTNLALGKP